MKHEEIKIKSIIRQLEAETALLVKAGHYQKGFPMVEPLYNKMSIVCAYHELSISVFKFAEMSSPMFLNSGAL